MGPMPEEVSPEVARGMPRDKINFPSNPRDASHEERETDVWKAVWMPWALDDEEARKKAYKDLLDCDFAHLLLNSPGTQHMLASGPEYGRMLSELKFDPMALDKAAKSGHACGIMAAAALAKEMLRKRALPKNKPEKPPESATEAKAYATKLFSYKKFAHAADMYALAIHLVDMRSSSMLISFVSASRESVTIFLVRNSCSSARPNHCSSKSSSSSAALRSTVRRWRSGLNTQATVGSTTFGSAISTPLDARPIRLRRKMNLACIMACSYESLTTAMRMLSRTMMTTTV